jgi:hypothetical protein
VAISRDFWTKDINRLVQEAGEGASVCLQMNNGTKHYIRRILHTGEQELETHAYMGAVAGPFIDSTSATHLVELPRALFETRTFSLEHQVQVDINGRYAVKHIRFEER